MAGDAIVVPGLSFECKLADGQTRAKTILFLWEKGTEVTDSTVRIPVQEEKIDEIDQLVSHHQFVPHIYELGSPFVNGWTAYYQ